MKLGLGRIGSSLGGDVNRSISRWRHLPTTPEEPDLAQMSRIAESEAEAAEEAAAKARARAIRLREAADAECEQPAHADENVSVTSKKADSEDPPTASTRRRRPRPSLRSCVLAVAGVFIIAALTTDGWMSLQHRKALAHRRDADMSVAAARQGVVTLLSMDFRHAKDDVQRIVANTTGTFRDDFAKRTDDFTTVVEDSKVVTTAKVEATAVQATHADATDVLVVATSEVTNSAGAKKEPRTWRLIVSVTRDNGQLKISKVEFVP